MSCSPPPIAPLTKDLPNAVEAKLEEVDGDFTGWTATAEVFKSHEQGMVEGESLFTPVITLKENVAADTPNNIPAKIAYSVEMTAEQVNSLWRKEALLKVIFINESSVAEEVGVWRLKVCLQPPE